MKSHGLLIIAILICGIAVLSMMAAPLRTTSSPVVLPSLTPATVPGYSTSALVMAQIYSTSTPNPEPNPALMAEITLVFANATNTQVAIAKTEYAIAETQIAARTQAVQNAQATQAAGQTQIVGTAQAAGLTQIAETIQATQTYGNMLAWAGTTATVLAATQQVERASLGAKLVTIWGGVILLLFAGFLVLSWIGVKIWRIYINGRSEKIIAERVSPDMHGRYPAVPSSMLGKGGMLIMPGLSHRAVIDPDQDDLTAEQALINKKMNNDLEATRALASSPAFGRQMAKGLTMPADQIPESNLTISKPDEMLHLLEDNPGLAPSWSLVEDWNGKDGIPYGVSGSGLELLSLEQMPHGGVFGQTGKGKSRYFLRPFIAGAIAAGHRVVIMGKQADFKVFTNHPNVTMLPVQQFTNPDEAARYAGFLKSIVEEMNRRDDYLVSKNASTWEKAGREITVLVLDELGNALDMMPSEIRKDSYRWVQGLVQEGRKAGFNIWMASQRAVGFKSIVEQLGRAVFHLADAEASRYALGVQGAEELPDGQFFAKFNRLKRCMAFDPTDDELKRFLEHRSVRMHEPINWIEGTATDVIRESEPPADDIEQKIRKVLGRMKYEGNVSLSQVQREVWGEGDPRGGKHFKQVQEIWIQMQAESATATARDVQNERYLGSDPDSATGSA